MGSAAGMIGNAFAETGFCYLADHGVSDQLIEEVVEQSRRFFRLPLDVKERCAPRELVRGYNRMGRTVMRGARHPDLKEYFQIGLELPPDDPARLAGQPMRGANQWPESPPGLRIALERYFDEVSSCAEVLLQLVALSLGAGQDFFRPRYGKRLQRTQVIYYPHDPSSGDDELFGVAPHTDYGCVTLLWQDDAGGLEVRTRGGEWIGAPPVGGTLLVNIGDLLQRWSNDRFASNLHRVRNRSGRERLSIATFYDPDYSALVDPRELGLPKGQPSAYPPVLAGDYIIGRISASLDERSGDPGQPDLPGPGNGRRG